MAQLKRKGFKFNVCFMAGLITGILIGATLLCVIVSYRMDMYHKRIAYLENTIQDKDARLEKLENTINNKNILLKDIEIILIFEGDEIDKIDIQKNIKEKYKSLLGKEVKNIDADLIIQVVDKRIFKIEEREYKLQVTKMILSEILKITVKVDLLE